MFPEQNQKAWALTVHTAIGSTTICLTKDSSRFQNSSAGIVFKRVPVLCHGHDAGVEGPRTGTLGRSLVWSQHASFSRNHADNRLSPWLQLHPLNANNLGHAALHPVIGFDRTVERVFKFCAGGRHRDYVAFADAGGSAEHIKRCRMQAGHVNCERRLGFVLGF